MACITPMVLKREYKDIDGRSTNIVPCGNCPACLSTRSNSWAFRLEMEMKRADNARFVTFTYDDKHLPSNMNDQKTLKKEHLQGFFKRIRANSKVPNLKYYACGEYGTSTKRPHYHAIVFNMEDKYVLNPMQIQKDWKHGHIKSLDCNLATIHYTTKYINKGKWKPEHDEETGLSDEREPEFAVMSKGLGNNFLTKEMVKFMQGTPKNYVVRSGGQKILLPRYYKERIYTKEERKFISEETAKLHEIRELGMFDSSQHKVDWIKDQFRKSDKIIREKRNAL